MATEWLSDANKSKIYWVIYITNDWKDSSNTKQGKRIIKRGFGTLKKQDDPL